MSLGVADSIITNSPYGSSSTTFKRAAVTYGRKRHAIEEEGPTSVPVARDWDDEVQTRTLLSVNDEASPCSDLSRLPSDEGRVNEDITKERLDETPEKLVFGWRNTLKKWNDQEEAESSTSNVNQPLVPKPSRPTRVDTFEMGCAATKYGLEPDMSPERLFATDDGDGGALMTKTTISPGAGVGLSRRSHRGVVHDSDSESELSNAKLGSSIHKSSPFVLQTPNSRSSPTPPTSDDEIPWSTSKGKEKANIVPRKNILPPHFDEESTESENLEGSSNNRPKRMKVRKLRVSVLCTGLETINHLLGSYEERATGNGQKQRSARC